MGIADTLARWWYGEDSVPTEERAISLAEFMSDDYAPPSSTTVSQETATRLSVVMACQRIIADSISTMPVAPYIKSGGTRKPAWNLSGPWLDAPHGIRDKNYAWETYISELVGSILQDGNAFVYALPFADERATELHVLNPKAVTVTAKPDGTKSYRITLGNESLDATDDNIVHIPRPPIQPGSLRGISPIDQARVAIGAAMDAEKYAQTWFANGGVPSGVLEYPGERTQEQADAIIARWNRRHAGAGKVGTALLTGGLKYQSIPFTFQQAQFIESRQFSVEDLARLHGVPLHMLNVSTPGAMSYASVEQNAIAFVVYTLLPLVTRIERAHDRLLPGPATFLRFNLSGLLRGDAVSRANYYKTRWEIGSLSANDIRRLEDESPIDGGDTYWAPMNLAPANGAETQTIAAKAAAAKALTDAGYDLSEAADIVGLPEPIEKPDPEPVPPAGPAMPMMPNPPDDAPDDSPDAKPDAKPAPAQLEPSDD